MGQKVRALYPGSFDPMTAGHLDILDRSLPLFEEIRILVAGTPSKKALLSVDERIETIRAVVENRPAISVASWDGLIMDYAKENGFQALIRGLRAASDFEYEFMMAGMNKKLNPDVETVFMMTSENLFFVSSTMIKELFHFGGDIEPYVPKPVSELLKKKKPKEKR